MDILRQIKDLIWQNNTCAVCGRPRTPDLLCPHCQRTIDALTKCPRCGFLLPPDKAATHKCPAPIEVETLLTCWPYAYPLKERLFNLKYHNQPQIAMNLGPLLGRRWRDFAACRLHADAIVPVPLHPKRQVERGYNQSALLAKALGKELHLPVYTDAVRRVLHTQALHSLSPSERHASLCQAFAPGRDINRVAGQNIIIVDDIITTGATVRYTAEVLHQAGAKSIWALAVAGHLDK